MVSTCSLNGGGCGVKREMVATFNRNMDLVNIEIIQKKG